MHFILKSTAAYRGLWKEVTHEAVTAKARAAWRTTASVTRWSDTRSHKNMERRLPDLHHRDTFRHVAGHFWSEKTPAGFHGDHQHVLVLFCSCVSFLTYWFVCPQCVHLISVVFFYPMISVSIYTSLVFPCFLWSFKQFMDHCVYLLKWTRIADLGWTTFQLTLRIFLL